MRVYVKDQRVLANCGTKDAPDWIPGVVIERDDFGRGGNRPCLVKLDRPSDGSDQWYFPDNSLVQDNARNRRKLL